MHSINSLTFLHFSNHVIVLPELSLVERRRAKERERWSKRYPNMTDDQKAKKNANKRSTRTITFGFLVDCTEQREVKRQRAREKYASMSANRKAELNAKEAAKLPSQKERE